jgi:hypothetical protein
MKLKFDSTLSCKLEVNAVQTFYAHNMQKEKQNQILFKTI